MTTTRQYAPGYDDVVDLSRYPIDDPSSPAYQYLVQACQEQLRGQGLAQLAGLNPPGQLAPGTTK